MTRTAMPVLRGPRGGGWTRNRIGFNRDVLKFITGLFQEYGEAVRLPLGPLTFVLVHHPELIQQVLKDLDTFDKNTHASRMIAGLTGQSVLVTNGDAWRTRRRQLQVAFTAPAVQAQEPVILRAAEDLCRRVGECCDRRQTLPASSLFMAGTYRIIEEALFSSQASQVDPAALEEAITTALQEVYRRIERPLLPSTWLSIPRHLRFRASLRMLDARVETILEEHRSNPQPDLLGHLLKADPPLSAQAIRDETITLLLAGHETSANALAWLFHLLSQHPETAHAIREELRQGLGIQSPLLVAAVEESLRLYPPIWAILRRVSRPVEFAGAPLQAGERILISPWVMHRHPEYWPDPERFDPTRFLQRSSSAIPPYAFCPFGGGPRICIGHALARLEIRHLAAALLRDFHFLPASSPARVIPEPGITLRPRQPLFLHATRV